MSLAGIYLIFVLSACLSFAPAQQVRGRSFTGTQDKDTNNVTVDQITADMLKSGLTTVFLPFIYIIIFILGLPSNAMAIWRNNNKLAIILSVCIWIFISVSSTPLYLYQQTVYLPAMNITTCHDVNSITQEGHVFQDVQKPFYYFMVMAGLAFFIPMIIIIVAYVLLLRSLGNSAPGKRRQRAVFLIITVLITFLVCFIPSNVIVVVHYALLAKGLTNNGYVSYITVLCLSSLNSCLDPFIYYYVSEAYREHVKNTLRCHSKQ
ncbi:Proteinase-activated receptor 2 [Triplophysa tibetana]|uniref:Proteinase-activated receptor 2 n=1 Tax=Triplophysa tibetana TaxID=1572043 RepID=A0A5A9PF75_9TELE|nr:Proteinase-activated receptor 2 [Triplophysa tibetana]